MDKPQPLHVIVVGGSIAGLMAGIKLKRAGHHVTVLEQSAHSTRTGAAAGVLLQFHSKQYFEDNDLIKHIPIGLPSHRLELLNMATLKPTRTLPIRCLMTSWEAVYYRLRANYDALQSDYCPEPPASSPVDGYATLRTGQQVSGVNLTSDGKLCVTARDIQHGTVALHHPDLVIAADGGNSSLRRVLQPMSQHDESEYCIWRGVVPTTKLRPELLERFEGKSTALMMDRSYVFLYTVPGASGSIASTERCINLVWYLRYESPAELRDILTSDDGHIHRTGIPKGKMRHEVWAKRKRLAKEIMHPLIYEIVDSITEPFVSVMTSHCSKRASFLDDRVFLIGDALVQCYPTTGQSSNLAAFGATTLVDAICSMHATRSAAEKKKIIRAWERALLAKGETTRRFSVSYGNFFLYGWPGAIWGILRYIACLIKVASMRVWWALLGVSLFSKFQ